MDPEGSPHSPDRDTPVPEQISKCHRSTRSLNLLATRFVRLLQEAEGGVLDIKDVSELTPVNHTAQQTLNTTNTEHNPADVSS